MDRANESIKRAGPCDRGRPRFPVYAGLNFGSVEFMNPTFHSFTLWIALASATYFAGDARATSRAPVPDSAIPPNIVFILVDDLGWTDLGCTGSDLYETPHIDRLAAQGVRFTNAYSACTVCSPTRAAILTGKYPARLHITDWIHGHVRPNAKLKVPDWTHYLPHDEPTLAAALHKRGYVSASIGKWHLGDGEEHYPTRHGFDVNRGGYGAGQPPSYFSPHRIPTLDDGPEGEYLTDRLSDEACRFIEANRNRPFFLYLPHYGVHTPLQAKNELVEPYAQKIKPGMKHTNATYAAMIHSLDEGVGRVLAKLEDLGIAERTVVFFTSDNGGLIGEPKRSITSNVPLRAGKGSAYEGGVRVPLIVRAPGRPRPGSVCHEPVISVDYYPTVLELTGPQRATQESRPADGRSIVRLLENPSANLDREAIYWHYPHYHPGGATPYGAVRAGDWKLIEFYEDMHVELYNLASDISEIADMAAAKSDQAAELRAKLHAWRASVGAQMPVGGNEE